MLTPESFIASNLGFKKKYCYKFGRGTGLGAEFIGMLKKVDRCQRKGIQFCLQKITKPKGFAIEKGWCDYFEPIFPEIELGRLAFLNRAYFPLGRMPIGKTIARSLLRLRPRADYFLFDDILLLPDQSNSVLPIDISYWLRMQTLTKTLWRYNQKTRTEIAALSTQQKLTEEYTSLHIRRGDKNRETSYIPTKKYINTIESLDDRIPRRIFVATDDEEVYVDLQRALTPKFELFRNIDFFPTGYDQTKFNHSSASDRRKMTIAFLFDLQMMIESKLFIGSSSSNVFCLVRYFRANEGLVDLVTD